MTAPNYDYGDPLTLSPATGDAATNSARLAAACGSGKSVFVTRPGTYHFALTGAGYQTDSLGRAYRKCVDLGNLRMLRGAPGVVFKMADGQMQDSGDNRGPCSILCSNAPTDLTIQNLRLEGNTAGQTSWTGDYNTSNERWTQLDGSHGICVSSVGAGYGRVNLEDVQAYDFFANPIICDGSSGFKAGTARGRRIWYGDCGEGMTFDDVSDVDLDDVVFVADSSSYTAVDSSTKGKTAGDGLEAARCRNVLIKNFRSWTRQGTVMYAGGGVIDCGGSDSITIDGLYCRHWQAGVGADISNTLPPKAVVYRNHHYLDVPQTALFFEYPANYELENIIAHNCGHLLTATASSAVRPMHIHARNIQCWAPTGDLFYLRGDIRLHGENVQARTGSLK